MSLTRRNVATVGEAAPRPVRGSIWEQEADDYWKEMEPAAKRYRRLSKYAACVVLALAAGGGTFVFARTAWQQRDVLGVSARWLSSTSPSPATPNPTAVNSVAVVDAPPSPASPDPTTAVSNVAVAVVDASPPAPTPPIAAQHVAPAAAEATVTATAATVTGAAAPVYLVPVNPAFSTNPAAADLLRARCRVRGVQTRWHEETCRKLCVRDPQNSACMNGCSYGSITVTKLTCDQVAPSAIPTATECPDGVSCSMACKAYDSESPYPDLRNSCERACANVVASSCARILQIHRDLYQGMPQ